MSPSPITVDHAVRMAAATTARARAFVSGQVERRLECIERRRIQLREQRARQLLEL
jgi:hypothetical protein